MFDKEEMFDKDVSQVVEDSGFKGILYAPSGVGKTYSISTAPNQEGVAILSAESGLRTLRKLCPKTKVEVIKDMNDLRVAFEYLNGEKGKPFHTVFLDSITEIGEIVLAAELAKSKDPRQAYGELATQAMKIIKAFRDMQGKNIILIAQQDYTQDAAGRMFYAPAMPGKKLAPKIPFWQDAVFCLRIRKAEDGTFIRAFQTRPVDEEYVAKFRGDELEAYEPPDWSVIFSKINNTTTQKGE